MVMINKIGDLLRRKAEEFLPPWEPRTEEEILYEKAKKRIYEMHLKEEVLFYTDYIWEEQGQIHLYGEFAKGRFLPGQDVVFLDDYGERLFSGKVDSIREEKPESVQVKRKPLGSAPGIYLIVSFAQGPVKEETFVRCNYLMKEKNQECER